jgi:gamma-glutamyl phosphate reductase
LGPVRRALLALAAAAALAGCGSPSDAFVDDVDAVCVRFDPRARDIARRTVELQGRPRDRAFLQDALTPVLEDAVALNAEVEAALRAVRAPEDIDRRKRDNAAGAIADQLALLRRQLAAARAGDVRGFAALQDPLVAAGAARQRAIGRLQAPRCLL